MECSQPRQSGQAVWHQPTLESCNLSQLFGNRLSVCPPYFQRPVWKFRIVECLCTVRSSSLDEKSKETEPCQCFMFRSRRSTLVKRLWKSRISQNETSCSTESAEDLEVKSVAHSVLKRLKEKSLEVLVQSVESKGGETTECVLLPKGDLRLGKRTAAPHVLCCQIWRWPDLEGDLLLKRLPCCLPTDDPTSICCNPYHWSRLVLPGKPSLKPTPQIGTCQVVGAAIFVWGWTHDTRCINECVYSMASFTNFCYYSLHTACIRKITNSVLYVRAA